MLQPLTMTQIADVVGVHETTVSRAIANKYIRTPHGVFEFKYFFTPGYQNDNGASVSNTSVKEMIADLVAGEDKGAPFSDQELVTQAPGKGHQHRAPHGRQVPRGAGDSPEQPAARLQVGARARPGGAAREARAASAASIHAANADHGRIVAGVARAPPRGSATPAACAPPPRSRRAARGCSPRRPKARRFGIAAGQGLGALRPGSARRPPTGSWRRGPAARRAPAASGIACTR